MSGPRGRRARHELEEESDPAEREHSVVIEPELDRALMACARCRAWLERGTADELNAWFLSTAVWSDEPRSSVPEDDTVTGPSMSRRPVVASVPSTVSAPVTCRSTVGVSVAPAATSSVLNTDADDVCGDVPSKRTVPLVGANAGLTRKSPAQRIIDGSVAP